MAEASGWLLELGQDQRAAVGERELIHLVQSPTLLEVPLTPPHCRQVLAWEGRLLPVLDLAGWLTGLPTTAPGRVAGICAFRPQDEGEVGFAALLLADIPLRLVVDDDQACELPPAPAGWEAVSIACFEHQGRPVPVLDLPWIFGGGLDPSPDQGGGIQFTRGSSSPFS